MISLAPSNLQALFEAFAALDQGSSVCLEPAEDSINTDPLPPPDSPSIGLWSSGSTGRPKRVWRRWSEIKPELRADAERTGWVWASPFPPTSFAGIQAAAQAWAGQGEVITLGSDWPGNWKQLAQAQALSCTPTFLDLMLQTRPHQEAAPALVQVTLGGEVLSPAAGARFRQAFPSARFNVIYASAEHGVLLKTRRTDGWYEIDALERRFPGWRVGADGELQICKNGSWVGTGDLAEINGRVARVLGRLDRVANIAGTKVSLDEVAWHAEQVAGVRRAMAFAAPSPVSGQIVVLRFTPDDGFAQEEVEQRLQRDLRERLRKEAWPRRWETGPIEPGPGSKRPLS